MPIYNYREKTTQVMIEIIRKMSEAEKLPIEEEISKLAPEDLEKLGDSRDWEKYIGRTFWKRGANYGHGSKGNW